ncbi:hypothetical protein R3O67_32470 [Bacillus cereus]|uniref:hypothetical protein n=1 Tax=Bacillus cereus TaxID=1396 RepID=UPI00307A9779
MPNTQDESLVNTSILVKELMLLRKLTPEEIKEIQVNHEISRIGIEITKLKKEIG